MSAVEVNIEVPRNGHYFEAWQLRDAASLPIDLTGHAIELDIRAIAGAGAVLAQADVDIYDPVNGCFNLTIDGADLGGLPGQTEIVRLAYDLRHIFPDGIKDIPVRGHIILMPEVTT